MGDTIEVIDVLQHFRHLLVVQQRIKNTKPTEDI